MPSYSIELTATDCRRLEAIAAEMGRRFKTTIEVPRLVDAILLDGIRAEEEHFRLPVPDVDEQELDEVRTFTML